MVSYYFTTQHNNTEDNLKLHTENLKSYILMQCHMSNNMYLAPVAQSHWMCMDDVNSQKQ